jgi:hypothetical protein
MHIEQPWIPDAAIVLNGLAAGLLSGRTKDIPQRSRYGILLPCLCVKSGENEKLHVASFLAQVNSPRIGTISGFSARKMRPER